MWGQSRGDFVSSTSFEPISASESDDKMRFVLDIPFIYFFQHSYIIFDEQPTCFSPGNSPDLIKNSGVKLSLCRMLMKQRALTVEAKTSVSERVFYIRAERHAGSYELQSLFNRL